MLVPTTIGLRGFDALGGCDASNRLRSVCYEAIWLVRNAGKARKATAGDVARAVGRQSCAWPGECVVVVRFALLL